MSYEVYNIPDPRPVIERLRRVQLREICRRKGIPLPTAMPTATVMRALIQAEGGIEAVMKRPDRPEGRGRDALQAMNMIEIRKMCSDNGVLWKPTDKKEDLIERLLDDQD